MVTVSRMLIGLALCLTVRTSTAHATGCERIRGRAVSYRGDGWLSIWHVGTHHTFFPADKASTVQVCQYIDRVRGDEQPELFADFTVCPMAKYIAGASQPVRVTGVEHPRVVAHSLESEDGEAAQVGKDARVFPEAHGAQTETDEYTRYELLGPETASFRIYYEVTATTAGAKYFYNPIRKGSVASDESVTDAMTGKPLVFVVVSGAEARKDPLMAMADLQTDYIRVTLARPVPEHGQGRVVILKTYKDPASYFADPQVADGIVFHRPLGIRRDKVVLPAGYEVTGLTVPSQILTEADGRVSVSFLHAGAGEAPLVIHAVKDAQVTPAAAPGKAKSWESPYQGLPERARLSERAHQDRDITYFLQPPETHSFMLYHDYTETRAAVNAYGNVVRTGSEASAPSAYVLDTGQVLKVLTMTGAAMKKAGYNVGEEVEDAATVVVIPFTPVKAGESLRLRIAETYTAPVSYRLEGEELVFDRSLGRPRNAVVLPSGWYCSGSAEPATVTELEDGRVRLEFWDGAPEAMDVLVRGRRRVGK